MLLHIEYPQHLSCDGRTKQPIVSFVANDILFLGYRLANLDSESKLKTETIRLPDWSCNWGKYSRPEDVRVREKGQPTDGCLSITVEDIRYNDFATVVHDPICGVETENYSHCEVRAVQPGFTVNDEPPKNASKRDNRSAKDLRHAWRRHVRNRLQFIIPASA